MIFFLIWTRQNSVQIFIKWTENDENLITYLNETNVLPRSWRSSLDVKARKWTVVMHLLQISFNKVAARWSSTDPAPCAGLTLQRAGLNLLNSCWGAICLWAAMPCNWNTHNNTHIFCTSLQFYKALTKHCSSITEYLKQTDWNQNIQEVKNDRFLIWTRQNKVSFKQILLSTNV